MRIFSLGGAFGLVLLAGLLSGCCGSGSGACGTGGGAGFYSSGAAGTGWR